MTYRVTFTDIDDVIEREEWAVKNCNTFAYRTITDISDVSMTTDTLYDFYFGDEKDAMWFKLYWS